LACIFIDRRDRGAGKDCICLLRHDLRTFFSAGSVFSVVKNSGYAASHLPIFPSTHLPAALAALPSVPSRLRSGQASAVCHLSSVIRLLSSVIGSPLSRGQASVPRFRGDKLLPFVFCILFYSLDTYYTEVFVRCQMKLRK
jgi:hypothetical protein